MIEDNDIKALITKYKMRAYSLIKQSSDIVYGKTKQKACQAEGYAYYEVVKDLEELLAEDINCQTFSQFTVEK